MNTEKTPLVQKLILGVLTLIFVCLVVLIAQNRTKPAATVPEPGTLAEPATAEADIEQPQPSPAPPPKPPTRVTPRSISEQAAAQATRVAPPPMQPQSTPDIPTPQPYVTLVSPARPAPLDIVVHPHAPVLKTELCGRVRLEGVPPREIAIPMTAPCSRLQEEPATTRHYVVGAHGGLANVLVYIKSGLPSEYVPPPLNAPTVTVSRCFYEPYVLGMQAGQKLTLLNTDALLHNVHGTG